MPPYSFHFERVKTFQEFILLYSIIHNGAIELDEGYYDALPENMKRCFNKMDAPKKQLIRPPINPLYQ